MTCHSSPSLWLQTSRARNGVLDQAIHDAFAVRRGLPIVFPRGPIPLREHVSVLDAVTYATCIVALQQVKR